MDSLSVICIVIVTIVGRGPLTFAPSATLGFYDRWILSTNARFRLFGVVIATLAMALLFSDFGEGALDGFLHVVGWVVAAMALSMLVAPNVSRRFLRAIFDHIENSVDDAIVRVLGLLVVVVGAGLIYVGVYVV